MSNRTTARRDATVCITQATAGKLLFALLEARHNAHQRNDFKEMAGYLEAQAALHSAMGDAKRANAREADAAYAWADHWGKVGDRVRQAQETARAEAISAALE